LAIDDGLDEFWKETAVEDTNEENKE